MQLGSAADVGHFYIAEARHAAEVVVLDRFIVM